MGRFLFRSFSSCVCVLAFTLVSKPAFSYTPTVNSNGTSVHWRGNTKLNLVGNPKNKSGLDETSFFNSVVRSLQRWKTAAGARVTFDYWQGSDRSSYPANSEYNGQSNIYFSSNTEDVSALNSSVLGLTQVWYDTDSGEILETDIVLNDMSYRFTNDPRHTSGYGTQNGTSGDGRQVYIENVITHELGHAFGLSHSGGLQSTMLFMESPEQAFLGCDEQVAMRAIYPVSNTRALGSLSGSVVSESTGSPVFGAHVLAISRRRGTVLASAVTDKSGRYVIAALEPGTYFLMIEPFFAGASALPSYYAGINPKVCGGQSFGRTLLMDGNSSIPYSMGLEGGTTNEAPTLVAKCTSGNGAVISPNPNASRTSTAPVIFDGEFGGTGFGLVDRFTGSNSLYYRLKHLGGQVEIHAMGYSLYSPVHTKLELLDSAGNPVSIQSIDQVYTGTSGYVNYDSMLSGSALPRGDYLLKVSSSALSASVYPAGPISLDGVPFVLLTGSFNEAAPSNSAIPFNARCRMEENFASYSSPQSSPPRQKADGEVAGQAAEVEEDDDGGGFLGFCGNTSRGSGGSGPSGPPSATAILGWFLPWILMACAPRLTRLTY